MSGYVEIQVKVGPSWQTFKRTSFPSFTVTAGREYTRSAQTACVYGSYTFRTKAFGQGYYLGSYASATDYSQSVSNPC